MTKTNSKTKIYNPHTKGPSEAQDFVVRTHQEFNKAGVKRNKRYVEYTVIGKNRQWTDFMTIRDFKRLNPTVTVKGLE